MDKKKYKNKARCKNCDCVVESKFRHDFVSCACFKETDGERGFFLDGGNDYHRFGGNFNDLEWLQEELE